MGEGLDAGMTVDVAGLEEGAATELGSEFAGPPQAAATTARASVESVTTRRRRLVDVAATVASHVRAVSGWLTPAHH